MSILDPAAQWVLRLALAWLLLSAAQHKLSSAEAFRSALEGYGLLPRALVGAAARGLAFAELAAGLALLAPPLAAGAAALAAGLFALYGAAIALNLARGRRDIECGCGGPDGRRVLGWPLVARNAVLVAVAALAAFPAAPRVWVWLDSVSIGAGALVLALLYVAVDGALANAPRLAALRSSR